MTAEDGSEQSGPHDDICCGGLCQKQCCTEYGKKRLPVITWAPLYNFVKAKSDFIAGITVGLMVVPQSLAYAVAAGLPAVYGLYASYIGAFVYIFFGTSKDVTVGPTSIMSSLVASLANGDVVYAICLSLVAGCYMLIFGLLEFGWLMWLISSPTLQGFTSAAALRIAAGELGDLLGLPNVSSGFIEPIIDIIVRYKEIRWTDTLLGVTCLIILLLLWLLQQHAAKMYKAELNAKGTATCRYYIWRSLWYIGLMRNIIVVCGAALLDYVLYVDDGNPFFVVGYIEAGLQGLNYYVFTMIAGEWASLLVDGLIIAFIGLLEGLAIAQAFGKKNRYEIDNSQEMVALGMCNIAGSFFLAYPVTGSFSRSSVNSESGVMTQFGSFWTALVVVLCLLFLTSFFAYIPMAALAAVIIFAVAFMVNFMVPVRMWSIRKMGTVSWIVSFLSVLILGIEYGIAIAVIFDLVLVVAKNLRPQTHTHDMGEGVIMIEVDCGWNYLSVNYVKNQIDEAVYWERKRFLFSHSTKVNAIILDMSKFSEIDITAMENLIKLQEDCKHEKILLFSVGLDDQLSEDAQKSGVTIPNFATSEEAVVAAKKEINIAVQLQEIQLLSQPPSTASSEGGSGPGLYGTFMSPFSGSAGGERPVTSPTDEFNTASPPPGSSTHGPRDLDE